MASIEARTPLTDDDMFEIGSITKQFSAAGLLKLVEAGKVSLDDPLSKFVKEYPNGDTQAVRPKDPPSKSPASAGLFLTPAGTRLGDLHHSQRIAPLHQQLGFTLLRRVQVFFLDVSVAADVFGDAGDLGGKANIAAVQ